jgi:hypothetical protein
MKHLRIIPTPEPAVELIPWMTCLEIEAIERLLHSDWHVLEYGSGGSTTWLSARVDRVTSIEHDQNWGGDIHQVASNVDLRLVPPEWPLKKRFGPAEPGQFESYVAAADDISPDLVIVDGRDRVRCAERWTRKSLVLLHDANRRRYQSLNLQFICETLAIVKP